jgi:hypothetical protein
MNQHTLRVSLLMVLLTSSRIGAESPAPAVGTAQQSIASGTTNWQIEATEHFDIAFTPVTAGEVERMRAVSEGAYQQVSAELIHELSLRPTLVLFSTRSDRERALASGTIPAAREHILLAMDIPASEMEGNVIHDLTHVFAFDIVPAAVGRDLPSWLHEGLAEFTRGTWGNEDVQLVREMLRTNALPRLGTLTSRPFLGAPRANTVVGHLAFDFLVARAGDGSVSQLLQLLRESASPLNAYLSATGLSAAEFDQQFELYVRSRFIA